jgi:hypothetical protein
VALKDKLRAATVEPSGHSGGSMEIKKLPFQTTMKILPNVVLLCGASGLWRVPTLWQSSLLPLRSGLQPFVSVPNRSNALGRSSHSSRGRQFRFWWIE